MQFCQLLQPRCTYNCECSPTELGNSDYGDLSALIGDEDNAICSEDRVW
jgi:hypothetical protein